MFIALRRLVVGTAMVLLLNGCSIPFISQSCADQAKPALDKMQDIAREWDDANALAGQTPRASLAGPIASLQQIRRNAEDIEVPGCAQGVHDSLVGAMDATITGYLDFLGQKGDFVVNASFDRASNKMREFNNELARIANPDQVVAVATSTTLAPLVESAVSADSSGKLAFTPAELTSDANRRIRLTFDNDSPIEHNWVLVKPGDEAVVAEAAAANGGDATGVSGVLSNTNIVSKHGHIVTIAPQPPGEYSYICTVPGHYQAGMKGKLTLYNRD